MSNFQDLINLLHSIDDKVLLEDFLVALTTEKERQELPKRVDITRALLEGKSQHQVADELKVGISTVTRGAKELAQGNFIVLRDEQEVRI
jgi:TrpR family trp operon transcriptional repressor